MSDDDTGMWELDADHEARYREAWHELSIEAKLMYSAAKALREFKESAGDPEPNAFTIQELWEFARSMN